MIDISQEFQSMHCRGLIGAEVRWLPRSQLQALILRQSIDIIMVLR